jgi:hypothetical protein
MTVPEITNLLRLHRAAQRGGAPQNFGWRRAAPDPDAMRASILRKIEAIERAGARAAQSPSPGADDILVPQAAPVPAESPAGAGEAEPPARSPDPA